MDKIAKALGKLSAQEKIWVKEIITKIKAGKTESLNVKKLKGREDIFRARKGKIRLIYRKESKKDFYLLAISRRDDHTYDF